MLADILVVIGAWSVSYWLVFHFFAWLEGDKRG